MGKILRVGNLGTEIDAAKLKEIFSEVQGVVHIHVVESQFSGTSRGFAFVELSSEKEALNCIELLNGKDCFGRTLSAVEAPNEKSRLPKKSRMK